MPSVSERSNFSAIFETFALKNGMINERQHDYKPRPTDVFVVGFVRSGTHWTLQLVHQLRSKGDDQFRDLNELAPWMPYYFMPVENYDFNADQPFEPRLFNLHETYETAPKGDGLRYVVVIRDPMDVASSSFRFFPGFYGEPPSKRMELFTQRHHGIISKYAGSNAKLIKSWYHRRHDKNVFWVHYEDLRKDLSTCIDKMAEFLGVNLTPEEECKVKRHCTFEYMSKHKDMFKGGLMSRKLAAQVGIEMRQGTGVVREACSEIGEGSKGLPAELRELVLDDWKRDIEAELGYKDYAEMLAETSLLASKN